MRLVITFMHCFILAMKHLNLIIYNIIPEGRLNFFNPEFVDFHNIYIRLFFCGINFSWTLTVDSPTLSFSCTESKTAAWYLTWLRYKLCNFLFSRKPVFFQTHCNDSACYGFYYGQDDGGVFKILNVYVTE
jgi:hypothetical protein